MIINRRSFMKTIAASSLSTAALMSRPAGFTAHAADVSGYKALVCVFLLGGLDSHDVILPYDQSSFDQYSDLRQTLIGIQGENRQRDNLTALTPGTNTVLGGRQIALPPEMPNFKTLFDQGDLAIVGNVGPLIEPTTRSTFLSGGARLPRRLFSHNDQQATWQAQAPEGAQFGWGGLFADAIVAAGGNIASPEFTSIRTGEFGPFLSGDIVQPYTVNVDGSIDVAILAPLNDPTTSPGLRDILQSARNTLGAQSFNGNHLLEQDIASAHGSGLDANDTFNAARGNLIPMVTAFPSSNIGSQLRAIAETISLRNQLLASRQIFFVGIGGFDTHSAQATTLPTLLADIDGAVSAFHSSMVELGLVNDVTLFTASDFGRTLRVNGDGTDHGWGGHHFVVGGAVNGGDIYGSLPPPELGHEADSGNGRLIPSVAVEEYAGKLGSWFGLSTNELNAALPGLQNFSSSNLDFI